MAYAVLLVAGIPFVLLAARIFFEPGFAVREAPVAMATTLAATDAVTVAAWVVRIVSGRIGPSPILRLLGPGCSP